MRPVRKLGNSSTVNSARAGLCIALAAALLSGCGSASSGGGSGAEGSRLYVAAQRSGEVDVVDARTLQPVATWHIGGDPHIVAVDRAHQVLWASSPKSGSLRALDLATGQVRATIPIYQPDGLALTPDGRTLLVTSGYLANGAGSVVLVDTTSKAILARILVGHAPHSIQISPDGRTAYVTVMYSGQIAVVDLTRRVVARRIPVTGVPYFCLLAGTHLWVTQFFAGSVTEYDAATGKNLASYPLVQGVSQLALAPDGSRLYVAERGLFYFAGFPTGNIGAAVAVIDLKSGASFPVTTPPGPDALLLQGDRLLVTGNGQGTLSAVALPSLHVTTVHLGDFPTSVGAA